MIKKEKGTKVWVLVVNQQGLFVAIDKTPHTIVSVKPYNECHDYCNHLIIGNDNGVEKEIREYECIIMPREELSGDDFENASQKLILDNSYMMGSIKNHTAIRNPQRIYESRRVELNQVKDNKIIRNPYLMLDRYRNELKIYEEKLDKINSVIMLKKEQKRQKQIYIIIIAAIVIVMIIVLILMLGGIL